MAKDERENAKGDPTFVRVLVGEVHAGEEKHGPGAIVPLPARNARALIASGQVEHVDRRDVRREQERAREGRDPREGQQPEQKVEG